MLMGITRIGNLIINENSFNLLLFFAEAKRRPLRVARWGAPGGVVLMRGDTVT